MPQKFQNRPSLLPQTPAMQTSYSNTVADPAQNDDDDDDICPVCESECTCDTPKSTPISYLPSQPLPSQSSSLKIRLTVPPSLLSTLHAQGRPHPQSSKPKTTTFVPAHDDGETQSSSLLPPLPKRKRGRPTKAEVEARRAAAMNPHSLTAGSRNITAGSSNKAKATRKMDAKRSKVKVKSRTCAPHQPRYDDDSDTSSESDNKEMLFRHGNVSYSSAIDEVNHDHQAVIDSDLSELSSLPDPGDDSSLEAEEERYIIQDASPSSHDKSRLRRELLGDNSSPRRFDRFNQNRLGRSGGRSSAEMVAEVDISDSDSSSEESDTEGQEGDEEDEDADEDADMEDQTPTFLPTHRGLWSDIESTEEEFDADVFFASLSDSDTSTVEFDHVFQPPHEGEDEGGRMSAVPFNDAFGESLIPQLTSAETTVLVSRDFNGSPVFTNGSDFTMGMLDLDFELNIVAQNQATVNQYNGFPGATSASNDEMWIASDTEEPDLDSEHGDTTDDDISVLKGVQTASGVVMFRFPTPPISSINPLSTLSPMHKRNSKNSSAKKRRAFEKSQHRNLVLATSRLIDPHSKNHVAANNDPMHDDEMASDSGQSSSLSSTKRHPTMGRFDTTCGPTMRHVIINGEDRNEIPSPISPETVNRARARVRRDSGSSRSRKTRSIRNESPFSAFSKHRGNSPPSRRSVSTDTWTRTSLENPDDTAPQPVTPIELDEVLDSSLIAPVSAEDEDISGMDSKSPVDVEADKHLERWDRVPMGAFRQTRHSGSRIAVTDGLTTVMEWAPNQPAAVSDGFCYGSPGGSLMRSRALPLFDTVEADTSRRRSALHQSHIASPTAIKRPAPDGEEGDRTPTGTRTSMDIAAAFGNTPDEEPAPKILSHKARRKARRRLVSISGGSH